MRTVYLCGGINGLSDSEATDWREDTKVALAGKFSFLDPMRRDFRGREADSVREIIDGDLSDIDVSDILIVNAARPSWGTAMEVFYANTQGKMIFTVCPGDRPSPWLIGHSSRIFKSLSEACEFLAS